MDSIEPFPAQQFRLRREKRNPKAGFGEIGSWICGKTHESNKCGAVFTAYVYQNVKIGRSKYGKRHYQKTIEQAFTTFMKTILLKLKRFLTPTCLPTP
jgi:hypothetical protein